MTLAAPQPDDIYTMARAYQPPRDPLDKPADPRVMFRDIPTAFAMTWDPLSVQSALAAHQVGMFTGSSLLTDSLLGDPRVQATLMTRTSSLFGRPVKFRRAASDTDGSVIKAWKAAWKKSAPTGTLTEIQRWTVMMGFCPFEVTWDTSGDVWCPYLKVWNSQFVWYNIVPREYIAITYDGLLPVTPGDGKWGLSTPHGPYRGWLHGSIRAVAQPWLARAYALRDWARYSEVHGIPIVKAKVPAVGDAKQKQRFQASLSNLGSESVVMLPMQIDGTGYDLELLEATDQSWQSFLGLVVQCDMSIILPLLGQNLTTEVKEGSFAAANTHSDVKQDVLELDNKNIADTLYRDVARPFAAFNFGDPEKAPYTYWDIEPIEENFRKAQTLQAFGSAVLAMTQGGVKFDPVTLAKQFSIAGIKPPEEQVARLTLTPTDVAKVVRVDEARTSQGLPPIGDDRGEMTIAELEQSTKPEPSPPPEPK